MENTIFAKLRLFGIGLILLSLGWAVYGGLNTESVPGAKPFKEAEAQFSKGNYDAALLGYEKSLRESPGFVPAMHARGRTLMFLNRFEEALAEFDQVIDKKPDFAISYANRALIKDRLGRYEEALQDYEHAFKLEPELKHAPTLLSSSQNSPTEKNITMEERAIHLRAQLSDSSQ
jgi:tetratricopeptide (TPR) repeat protein